MQILTFHRRWGGGKKSLLPSWVAPELTMNSGLRLISTADALHNSKSPQIQEDSAVHHGSSSKDRAETRLAGQKS